MADFINYMEIAAFLASAIAWNVIKKSKYMRLFPFLLFLIAAGEIFGYFLAVKYHNNRWFYNMFTPVQYLFYFAIMYFAIDSTRFKNFILASIIAYILLTAASYIFYTGKAVLYTSIYISGILLLIACLIRKLYELLEYPERKDFLKNPFFYILFAALIFHVVSVPFFAMNNWMANTAASYFVQILNNVFNVLNIVLYSTYTITFLWIRKTGSYS